MNQPDQKIENRSSVSLSDAIILAISVLALLVSFMSYLSSRTAVRISAESLDISKQEYQSQFNIIWDIEVANDHFYFKQLTGDQVPQNFKVLTPSLLGADEWMVPKKTKKYHTTRFHHVLQDLVDSKIGKMEHGYAGQAKIAFPIVIETVYSAQGKNYVDQSLYAVQFDALILDKPNSVPGLNYTGISFHSRILDNIVVQDYLDEQFEAAVASWPSISEQTPLDAKP